MFNTIGLLNTSDKNAFYRMTANIGSHSFKIVEIDWQKSNFKNFLFENEDFECTPAQMETLSNNEALIYQIDRFDFTTKEWENSYAYAVHPLFEIIDGKKMLIKG